MIKKIIFVISIICIIIDLVLSLVSEEYMAVIKDVAILLLVIIMSVDFYKKVKS